MIYKYKFGNPFPTETVINDVEICNSDLKYFDVNSNGNFTLKYLMGNDDIVYGLGEAPRGINKRGWHYRSWAEDNNLQTETRISLYAAHNFLLVSGKNTFGVFIDYAGAVDYDIGYSKINELTASLPGNDCNIYIIEGEKCTDIIREFRGMIGRSYIPPKWAFGFGQCRWGYDTEEKMLEVAREYRDRNIPLDMLYLDIDYMEAYKDFTIDSASFPHFEKTVNQLKAMNIHTVPIIDAGVKIEKGYSIYEEGVKGDYFCKDADGNDFIGAAWPGDVHFPDFIKPEAREWFGSKYKMLIDKGVDGFWNDMNEPAIFYTKQGIEDALSHLDNVDLDKLTLKEKDLLIMDIADKNRLDPYKLFYHKLIDEIIRHDSIHNIYGYLMTRSASEEISKMRPDERFLLFSRASLIGAHRYGGMWMGDNHAWWSHILLNLKMLPSLNMCGFLYCGADIGGFSENTTGDLMLRWLALGVFTPLLRNHSERMCWDEELYRYENTDYFIDILNVRYMLLPYLYSEYMKAALNNGMLFRPMAFDYLDDEIACRTEDQLMLGDIMIAPVYEQNAKGRFVYLPDDMLMIRFMHGGEYQTEKMSKGIHYVNIPLNEIVIFQKKNSILPIAKPAQSVGEVDDKNLDIVGWICDNAEYHYYRDDGISTKYSKSTDLLQFKNGETSCPDDIKISALRLIVEN